MRLLDSITHALCFRPSESLAVNASCASTDFSLIDSKAACVRPVLSKIASCERASAATGSDGMTYGTSVSDVRFTTQNSRFSNHCFSPDMPPLSPHCTSSCLLDEPDSLGNMLSASPSQSCEVLDWTPVDAGGMPCGLQSLFYEDDLCALVGLDGVEGDACMTACSGASHPHKLHTQNGDAAASRQPPPHAAFGCASVRGGLADGDGDDNNDAGECYGPRSSMSVMPRGSRSFRELRPSPGRGFLESLSGMESGVGVGGGGGGRDSDADVARRLHHGADVGVGRSQKGDAWASSCGRGDGTIPLGSGRECSSSDAWVPGCSDGEDPLTWVMGCCDELRSATSIVAPRPPPPPPSLPTHLRPMLPTSAASTPDEASIEDSSSVAAGGAAGGERTTCGGIGGRNGGDAAAGDCRQSGHAGVEELCSAAGLVGRPGSDAPCRGGGAGSPRRSFDLSCDGSEASYDYYCSHSNLVSVPSSSMEVVDLIIHHDRVLGSGQFGVVCQGEFSGREVAVKIMRNMSGHAAERALDGFRQELACLKSLAHPNIVLCLGGSCVLPHVYVVEELLHQSLADLLYRPPSKLRMRSVISIGLDIARGLHHIHSLPSAIVHCDLKPDNILLDKQGHAKIGDFGLAQFIHTSSIQADRRGVGTLAYMAPECLDPSLGHITEKSDMFSFGVLLWEMCTGELPWQGVSAIDFMQRMVVDGARLPIPDSDDKCPMALRHVITQCWDADPSARPDAQDVVTVLERMLRFTCD